MNKRLKIFVFLVLLTTLYLLPTFSFAVSWLPLVPCGLNKPTAEEIAAGKQLLDLAYYEPCTRCDAFRLADNVVHFILEGIVPPVAAVLFVAGGLMILLSGAYPKWIDYGKKIFWRTFIGLVIILASWLITNTFLKSFAPAQADAPWYRLTCDKTTGEISTGGPPVPTVPTTTQKAAQELIAAIGLSSFSTKADCGDNFHARQNIQDMAAGKFPAVCSPDCASSCVAGGPSGNIIMNSAILDGLAALWNRGIRFTVTSFSTGDHSVGSTHYKGRAVDFVVMGNQVIWIEARGFLSTLSGTARCERAGGALVPDCNLSQTSHIHWQK